jgi:mRNA interferase MazF
VGVKRGEVWWVRFPDPVGRRPAVLVSQDQAYRVRAAVTVVPLTQTIRRIPVEVSLGQADGVPRKSVANADTITTVPKHLLEDYLTTLSSPQLEALEQAIKFALDLP